MTDARVVVTDYSYDANGEILALNDNLRPERSQAYTYDDDEQRVVKSLPDGILVHYAYDSEGRLISETDGTTGDTIREYLWLGLTPIAVIAANDNAECDGQERIDELTALIAAKQDRIATWQAELITLADKITVRQSLITRFTNQNVVFAEKISTRQDLITEFESRIQALNDNITTRQALITTFEGRITNAEAKVAHFETRLAAAEPNDTALIAHLTERRDAWAAVITRNQDRITVLEAKIAAWQTSIANHQARIATLNARIATFQAAIDNNITRIAAQHDKIAIFQTRITTVNERITWSQGRITAHQNELDTLQAQCDAAGGSGVAELSYLHTDHLGKPQFATDAGGSVIWDAGANVTPFGDGIQLASAFTQNLQFPGQYYDAETTLSHNHHRTYDPALGRYLQSDPIGLAGGLNRYAYVGGNPLSNIDPTGEILPILAWMAVGIIADFALDLVEEKVCKCETNFPDASTVLNGAVGATHGLFGVTQKKTKKGFGGGGPSGDRTSIYSDHLHNRDMPPRRKHKFRKLGRIANKANIGLAAFTLGYRIGKIGKCVWK